jgi:hypothetical protein
MTSREETEWAAVAVIVFTSILEEFDSSLDRTSTLVTVIFSFLSLPMQIPKYCLG